MTRKDFMHAGKQVKFSVLICAALFFAPLFSACVAPERARTQSSNAGRQNSNAATELPPEAVPLAEKFAYPVGKSETLTAARDEKDDWYNALDFGADNHLGEDWNKNSGGNTDCGETVFAIGSGRIVYAGNAGAGWGNVVIVEHRTASGRRVESLYGHLRKILKTGGEVNFREPLGEVGNADGTYLCHLHFEIRTPDSPMWNQAGNGYSADNKGWLDPSDFIDKNRKPKN